MNKLLSVNNDNMEMSDCIFKILQVIRSRCETVRDCKIL